MTPGESVYAVKMAVFTARPRMIADLLALPGVRRHQISCRACNRLGVVVDVAHATEDTVKQAAKVASKPLLRSHTALRGSRAQGETPLVERQITPDHARAVADTAKIIGGNYLRIFAASVR